jgi:hypothetical protein
VNQFLICKIKRILKKEKKAFFYSIKFYFNNLKCNKLNE